MSAAGPPARRKRPAAALLCQMWRPKSAVRELLLVAAAAGLLPLLFAPPAASDAAAAAAHAPRQLSPCFGVRRCIPLLLSAGRHPGKQLAAGAAGAAGWQQAQPMLVMQQLLHMRNCRPAPHRPERTLPARMRPRMLMLPVKGHLWSM